jgi:hypothetical protein
MNGLVFYILFTNLHFHSPFTGISMTFDDWMSGTYQGLIFATTMYQVQEQISVNFKRII